LIITAILAHQLPDLLVVLRYLALALRQGR
jgi:hypothetical protein